MRDFIPHILTLFFGSILCASVAIADDAGRYADLASVPEVLKQRPYESRYEEEYLFKVLRSLRENGHDNMSIDQTDIEARIQKRIEQRQQRRFEEAKRQFLDFDVNSDGKVSFEEIMTPLEGKQSHPRGMLEELRWLLIELTVVDPFDTEQRRRRRAASFMSKYDLDKDGVVTLAEATTPSADRTGPTTDFYDRSDQILRDLLALDPDGDGRLTADELKLLAYKAFRTADLNGDGMLFNNEMAVLRGKRDKPPR